MEKDAFETEQRILANGERGIAISIPKLICKALNIGNEIYSAFINDEIILSNTKLNENFEKKKITKRDNRYIISSKIRDKLNLKAGDYLILKVYPKGFIKFFKKM